jgi:hypothetical protein
VQRLVACNTCARVLIAGVENIAVIGLGSAMVISGQWTLGMLFAFYGFKVLFQIRSYALVDKLAEVALLRPHLDQLADVICAKPEPDPSGARRCCSPPAPRAQLARGPCSAPPAQRWISPRELGLGSVTVVHPLRAASAAAKPSETPDAPSAVGTISKARSLVGVEFPLDPSHATHSNGAVTSVASKATLFPCVSTCLVATTVSARPRGADGRVAGCIRLNNVPG